jgi:nicotinamidase-related amidase
MIRLFRKASCPAKTETPSPALRDAFAKVAVAHIGIDMQKGYCDPCHPDNRHSDMREETSLPVKVNRFTAAMDGIALRHIWVAHTIPEKISAPSGQNPDALAASELYNIRTGADDGFLGKRHYSAFRETDLHERLQRQGMAALVISGLYLNQCVALTACDGARLGYDVTVMQDLCAHGGLDPDARATCAAELEWRGVHMADSSAVLRAAQKAGAERLTC